MLKLNLKNRTVKSVFNFHYLESRRSVTDVRVMFGAAEEAVVLKNLEWYLNRFNLYKVSDVRRRGVSANFCVGRKYRKNEPTSNILQKFWSRALIYLSWWNKVLFATETRWKNSQILTRGSRINLHRVKTQWFSIRGSQNSSILFFQDLDLESIQDLGRGGM